MLVFCFKLDVEATCLWQAALSLSIEKMGLYNYFPIGNPGEGVLPVLVMNTILSVALLKNMVRSVLQVVSCFSSSPNSEQDQSHDRNPPVRIRVTNFESVCRNRANFFASSGGNGGDGVRWSSLECCCCVCLSGFEAEEEVGELSDCKHFFHRGCLDKWLDDYQRRTCPLCRSMI